MTVRLEEIMRDFVAAELPAVVHRDIRLARMNRKADVLVGMRRSGKTYAMLEQIQLLRDSGVSHGHAMYVNLDDDRLGSPNPGTLDDVLETFFRISPEARGGDAHLFLDEIQVVSGWEGFCRRVLDTESIHLYLGGSSSKMLSKEVATSFRGRGITSEVLPYGLREFVRSSGYDPEDLGSPAKRSMLASLSDRYLIAGGFPETVGIDDFTRVQLLQGYVEMVVMKDIVERHGAENVAALRALIRGLFAANASQFSVSSFEGTLRSQGFRTTKVTLMSYLDHLADAFLVFLVPIDSRSAKARMVNPRKVYAVDPGLAAAMHLGGAGNRGALLENAVYLELRRRLGPLGESAIAYHRTPSGAEVDFVVDSPLPNAVREFVQVSESLAEAPAIDRETKSLAEAMASAPGSKATIVTRGELGELQTSAGPARIVPFWQWALERA